MNNEYKEKRAVSFFQGFVKSIEIDPNPASKKRILRHIEFRFPVSYDAEGGQILLRTKNDVECACLLSSKNTASKDYDEIGADAEDQWKIKDSE